MSLRSRGQARHRHSPHGAEEPVEGLVSVLFALFFSFFFLLRLSSENVISLPVKQVWSTHYPCCFGAVNLGCQGTFALLTVSEFSRNAPSASKHGVKALMENLTLLQEI